MSSIQVEPLLGHPRREKKTVGWLLVLGKPGAMIRVSNAGWREHKRWWWRGLGGHRGGSSDSLRYDPSTTSWGETDKWLVSPSCG